MTADLLLHNARVLTMWDEQPQATALAVRAGRIVAVGDWPEVAGAAPAGAAVLDCGGAVIVPGLIDAHVHLAAYAAALRAVDCSPAAVSSLDELIAAIAERASETPPGEWIRAVGYDEWALAEGRHPTRWDLDRATTRHPVRLIHRSGHARVLNSLGLALAGVTISSAEPAGGVIERRLEDGEPNGLLLDMEGVVDRAVPPLARAELVAGLREAGRRCLAAGVTAVQDMTHTNGPDADRFLTLLAEEAGFAPRLLPPAIGVEWADTPTAADGRPVKIMPREAAGELGAQMAAVARALTGHGRRGRQIAVHAVSGATMAALVATIAAGGRDGRRDARHRIEHAGQWSERFARPLAEGGWVVVSNPAFLHVSGERYRALFSEEDQENLYAVGAIRAAGIPVAAGSDAPVSPPDPLVSIAAAVQRRTAAGVALPGLGATPHDALAMHTTAAAYAAHTESELGHLAPGLGADLVLLSGPPEQPGTSVLATAIGGVIRYVAPDMRDLPPDFAAVRVKDAT